MEEQRPEWLVNEEEIEPGSRLHEASEAIRRLGTTAWDFGPAYEPSELSRRLGELPAFTDSLRSACSLSEQEFAVALVDWTLINNVHGLFSSGQLIDPVLALIDLATFISAALLYDVILVLDRSGDSPQAVNALFNLDNVVRPIDPDLDPVSSGRPSSESRMRLILNQCLIEAVAKFESAQRRGETWLEELGQKWKQLLPSADFTSHEWDAFDTRLGYTASPDRESGYRMIFEGVPRIPAEDLILDNDVHAVFYEQLAHILTSVLFPSHEDGGAVRYIGNCLRSPAAIARSGLMAGALQGKQGVYPESLSATLTLEEGLAVRWRLVNEKLNGI